MRLSLAPLLAAALLVSGCSYLPGFGLVAGTTERASCERSDGAQRLRDVRRCSEAALRQAVVGIETYYADHGSYTGVTIAALAAYDPTLAGVRLARVTTSRYCIESGLGGATFSAHGPPPKISAGGC